MNAVAVIPEGKRQKQPVYKPARSKLKTKEGGPLVVPLETDDLGVKAKPSLAWSVGWLPLVKQLTDGQERRQENR
jgi:hypothetical protein